MHPDNDGNSAPFPSGTIIDPVSKNSVIINIVITHSERKLTLNTDESYSLSVQQQSNKVSTLVILAFLKVVTFMVIMCFIISILNLQHEVIVTITANTYFGARHALETLSQLIAYNDEKNTLQVKGDWFHYLMLNISKTN